MIFGFHLITNEQTNEHFVACVRPGLPAFYSGLKDGDKIVEIDGIDVKDKRHADVVSLIVKAEDEKGLELKVVEGETSDFPLLHSEGCETCPEIKNSSSVSSSVPRKRRQTCSLPFFLKIMVLILD